MCLQVDDSYVVLILDDSVQVTCERHFLSNSSPYFDAMFSERFAESGKHEIQLHGINKNAMETLIFYARTHDSKDWCNTRLNITDDNVIDILQASGMLQFEPVRQFCCEHILTNTLRLTNALQVLGR